MDKIDLGLKDLWCNHRGSLIVRHFDDCRDSAGGGGGGGMFKFFMEIAERVDMGVHHSGKNELARSINDLLSTWSLAICCRYQ